MLRKLPNQIITRPWLRLALAVVVVIAGLAPVGVPILSDNTWRQASIGAEDPVPAATPFTYRWSGAGDKTQVLRSDDGGQSWHAVAAIPQSVAQIEAVRGDEQTVLARSATGIWISRDGGLSWVRSASLPSRPLSMVAGSKSTGQLLVGTESGGLLVSRDLGATWQVAEYVTLAGGGAAPLAITALAQNAGDDSILYAATGIWLGTSTTRLVPGGVFASQFHLLSHAVFKALLFLSAGAVIHAAHTRDMREMGGLGRQMPLVRNVMVIGAGCARWRCWVTPIFSYDSGVWCR